jgi:7-cyano-7-deazaguanine synthase
LSEQRVVCLLSGGLDSATVLYHLCEQGYVVYALSFDYGQRHRYELGAAKRIASSCKVKEHRVLRLDLDALGGSALTADIAVPKDRDEKQMQEQIPVTYVPARNTIFLAHALAWAEILDSTYIAIGVNHIDYSGYPDCRPEFIEAFEHLASLATAAGVQSKRFEVLTPLINMKKAEIIQLGMQLAVDYSVTHSCYDPDERGRACARCDACSLRLRGFAEAGREDPAEYQPDVPRPDRKQAPSP